MKPLLNKWALVTGSARGIGQQIAVGLAKNGANVIVHGRTLENTKETMELLKEFGVETDAIAAELSNPEDVKRMVAEINAKHGGVDILYNNAGIQNKWEEIWDIKQESWETLFQINLYSLVTLSLEFAKGMKERGYGRIVNLSTGIKDVPQMAPYGASKAAVDKFTMDFGFQMKGTGVLVNGVDPGWLKTDLGGPNADNEVETVLPGALVPVLVENDDLTGSIIKAQEYRS